MNDKSIWKLLLKQSPPVMLALLIQSVYNIVDSFFVAKYSEAGLTALSIIFPVQLLMTALATGTGVGANILISKTDSSGDTQQQPNYVKANLFLETIDYIFYAGIGMVLLRPFYEFSSTNPDVRTLGYQYGSIILIGSFGFFIESGCTKILQAKGNMVTPMVAQIIGAIANIILDPILIFGCGKLPGLGIYGAAIATIVGQWVAMLITFLALCKTMTMNGKISAGNCVAIYRMGFPSILMQSLYTLYIIGLNLILKQFTEDAVTVLGIYYKLQTFFFIPLMGLQQVIVPIVSFFHGAGNWKSAKKTLFCSVCISSVVMLVSTVVFLTVPKQLITIFSPNPSIMDIGELALRIIAISFLPTGFTMMLTVYFQGVGKGSYSTVITVLRQIVLLVPVAWMLHFIGLPFVWLTFPLTEAVAFVVCLILFSRSKKEEEQPCVLQKDEHAGA